MYDYIIWNIPITDTIHQVFQYRYSRQTKMSRLTNPHWNGCTTSHFSIKVSSNKLMRVCKRNFLNKTTLLCK